MASSELSPALAKGGHLGRRNGDLFLSHHACFEQTMVAYLRLSDGLLLLVGVYAGWDPRDLDYQYAHFSAQFPTTVGGW